MSDVADHVLAEAEETRHGRAHRVTRRLLPRDLPGAVVRRFICLSPVRRPTATCVLAPTIDSTSYPPHPPPLPLPRTTDYHWNRFHRRYFTLQRVIRRWSIAPPAALPLNEPVTKFHCERVLRSWGLLES